MGMHPLCSTNRHYRDRMVSFWCKYLVDKKDIDPKKILVISFTNKAVAFVSLVIIYRHRMNIVRIAKGTEFSLYDTFGKKKKEENEA